MEEVAVVDRRGWGDTGAGGRYIYGLRFKLRSQSLSDGGPTDPN